MEKQILKGPQTQKDFLWLSIKDLPYFRGLCGKLIHDFLAGLTGLM
jgi:hypothetical protein